MRDLAAHVPCRFDFPEFLDAEAEHAIYERFRTLTRGRTAILISHRFPTVRMADRILVIEHGRILEQGTHGDLLAAGGRYAEDHLKHMDSEKPATAS